MNTVTTRLRAVVVLIAGTACAAALQYGTAHQPAQQRHEAIFCQYPLQAGHCPRY